MKTIRAFIAIPLPAETLSILEQTTRRLAGQTPGGAVRWVKAENIHLTLHFLGDTAEEVIPTLATGLDRVAGGQKPFTLQLDKIGCFPHERRPRVIWVGITGQQKALQALHQAIGDMLEPLGWKPEERPFQPHLTLGRVKDSRQVSGLPWGEALETRPLPVTMVQLIESQLRSAGPIYTVRHTSALSG
ncbi:MAG: RNA 2',3'-cyclic phosphodiesterase [Chloroflexi bacterium]|nr:RNA 2',3'-cyclic phosphodiesterase [Chloroflexota bacterium]MCI0578020.1 RNA 2',3'-cyclic phosphodiesterase [Chloroflexota bacterium]MCI0644766.1 RNA 2',3'-cyclic phosphodiesterase [Chloroflexota bacterium]MCI0728671.1 RNA 2',3'-cyclic phosphodiesterase [Chloroflexota bacterium]